MIADALRWECVVGCSNNCIAGCDRRRAVGDPAPRVRRRKRIHRRDRTGRHGLVTVVIATAATAGGQKEGKGGNAA